MVLFVDMDNNIISGIAKVKDIKQFGLINASRMYGDLNGE
jgi:hypothetical protein